MVKAHGGPKDMVRMQKGGGMILGGLVTDTMANTPKMARMRGLDRLVAQTTGIPREEPIMEGVIASTVPSHMKDVPEIHKVPAREVGKTKAKRMGQVPYGGKMY